MNQIYRRSEIYYADLGDQFGSEQRGYRPVVIVQNDVGNLHSPTVIVASITSKTDARAKLPTHHYLGASCGLERPSVILTEQLDTLDKRRLEKHVGFLDNRHLRGMNHALAVSVGLIEPKPKAMSVCLCGACANNFNGTGEYYLKRINPYEAEKGICTYCNQRLGFGYMVVERRSGRLR